MLPNSKHAPTAHEQALRHLDIACDVSPDLPSPVPSICRWHPTVPPAAVPETPIHKHHKAFHAEHEIRLAEEFLIPSPADDAVRSENSDELDLRALVSAGSDSRHHLRPLPFGDYVGHKDGSNWHERLRKSCASGAEAGCLTQITAPAQVSGEILASYSKFIS